MAQAGHINANDFLELSKRNQKAVVIDVRDADKFDEAHVDGAVNIHKTKLEAQIADIVPDKTTEIYCHCGGGQSGPRAAQALADMGYENVSVIDGGWRALKTAMNKS